MIQSYLKKIAILNNLDANEWMFHHAMLFLSKASWWDSLNPTRPGKRKTSHEGIDVVFYKNKMQQVHKLNTDTLIPSASNGKVINICKDFIGKSIIILDDLSEQNQLNIIYVYAHILPDQDLKNGSRVKQGRVIAEIAKPDIKKTTLLPHLHFSVMEIPKDIPAENLNWKFFCNPGSEINFINPLFI